MRGTGAVAVALLLAAACGRRAPSSDGGARRSAAPSSRAGAPASASSSAAESVVRVVFVARDPRSLCRTDDCGGSPISIRKLGADRPLVLAPGNAIECTRCIAPEPAPACARMGVGVEEVELAWDGGYYELSTCGAGTPCAARRSAAPGRYVAELCAIRNTRTIDSIGAPVCVDTGQHTCERVEFDYPGPDVVRAAL